MPRSVSSSTSPQTRIRTWNFRVNSAAFCQLNYLGELGSLGPQLFPSWEDSTAAGPDVSNVSFPGRPTVLGLPVPPAGFEPATPRLRAGSSFR